MLVATFQVSTVEEGRQREIAKAAATPCAGTLDSMPAPTAANWSSGGLGQKTSSIRSQSPSISARASRRQSDLQTVGERCRHCKQTAGDASQTDTRADAELQEGPMKRGVDKYELC